MGRWKVKLTFLNGIYIYIAYIYIMLHAIFIPRVMFVVHPYSVYEGEVLEGLRNGYGLYRCGKNKLSYNGEWQKGKKHGKVCIDLSRNYDHYKIKKNVF